MAAGALIFNNKNELLIVKPNYKDRWSIPGGVVDVDESPRQACLREVKEEIGIDLPTVTFLCVDYTPKNSEKNESLQFTFFGGIINDEKIRDIKIQKEELDAAKFVATDEAFKLLGGNMGNLAKRLLKCVEAIKTGTAIYLEDGAF